MREVVLDRPPVRDRRPQRRVAGVAGQVVQLLPGALDAIYELVSTQRNFLRLSATSSASAPWGPVLGSGRWTRRLVDPGDRGAVGMAGLLHLAQSPLDVVLDPPDLGLAILDQEV